jgi:hypothetical protein
MSIILTLIETHNRNAKCMDPNAVSLSSDAYNAYLLRNVIEATTPPNESEADTAARSGTIIAMFKGFEPCGAIEAMIACHCVTLQFVLMGAMRDAANAAFDPATLTRMRTTSMAISKTLHLWVTKLETIKKRNEARLTEALKAAETAAPVQGSVPAAGLAADPPACRPGETKPSQTAVPLHPAFTPFGRSTFPDEPLRDAMLAPAALSRGVRPIGAAPAPAS